MKTLLLFIATASMCIANAQIRHAKISNPSTCADIERKFPYVPFVASINQNENLGKFATLHSGSEESTLNVTVKAIGLGDERKWDLWWANTDTDKDGIELFVDEATGERISETVIQLSYGHHIFMFTFNYPESNDRILIKEMDITENTSLEFKATDAVHQMKFKTVLPDGNPLKLATIRPLEQEPYFEIIDPGNPVSMNITGIVMRKDMSPIYIHSQSIDCNIEGFKSVDETTVAAPFFNDFGDDFSYWQQRVVPYGNDVVCVFAGSNKFDTNEIINSADGYNVINEEFVNTPSCDLHGSANDSRLILPILLNGYQLTDYFMKMPEFIGKPQLIENFCTYMSSEAIKLGFLQPVLWGFPDGGKKCIWSLPIIAENGLKHYINTNHDQCDNISFHKPIGGGKLIYYPGHERFSMNVAGINPIHGNSSPICSVMNQIAITNDDSDIVYNYLMPAYIGRYGEVRSSDLLDLKVSVKYNGEECFNEGGDVEEDIEMALEDWAVRFGREKHPAGVFDMELINANVRVDGNITGHNITRTHVDWRTGDQIAPTLQMLMFRGKDDQVTDRFETPDEGMAEFSGADFLWYSEGRDSWFEHKPMTVKVEYAPYGEHIWEELPVVELPEYFFMPNFGYFYRSDLSGVNRVSANGWFDLRFTLTDEKGNWQTQEVSPAFHVGSLSGGVTVTEYAPSSVGIEAVYDLNGRRLDRVCEGVNIVVLTDGTRCKLVRCK